MNLAKQIGLRIKSARQHQGLNQEDLAKALNVTRPQVAHYESGKTLISVDQLNILAKVLDCSVPSLLGIENDSIASLPQSSLEVIELMDLMETADRLTILDFARYLVEQRANKNTNSSSQ